MKFSTQCSLVKFKPVKRHMLTQIMNVIIKWKYTVQIQSQINNTIPTTRNSAKKN